VPPQLWHGKLRTREDLWRELQAFVGDRSGCTVLVVPEELRLGAMRQLELQLLETGGARTVPELLQLGALRKQLEGP
jgi:hypothetical protein